MSLHRFFLDGQVLSEQDSDVFVLRLSPDDLQHARALRLKPGEHIAVIDAAADYFECEVVSWNQDALEVSIAQKLDARRNRPSIVLVQGISKGEKMDTVIRQATELGIEGFIPFACRRSIVKLDDRKADAKLKRWRAIAKSAAMQSGQPAVPEIAEPARLDEVCAFVSHAAAVLVCWEEATGGSLRKALENALGQQQIAAEDARVAIVVGPEGGLDQEEVAALLDANRFAYPISLGSSILRTETAGVIAPALALYELGGFE